MLGHLECLVRQRFDAGDHTIFVAEALEAAVASEENPLLFFRGGYRNVAA